MKTTRRSLMTAASALAFAALTATSAVAQEVTLKMHQMLPQQAAIPSQMLEVWANNVEEQSNGAIKVDRYPAMQLGGVPPELVDQVQDGVADVIWTVVGYTPGRFPATEVFELPFFVDDARAATYAYWTMYEESMRETDFPNMKMLATFVHGPGLFHTKDPVETPADLEGMKIRGGSRLVNQMLELVGATPVGMPVPGVSEALSKGVIDGTTLPWEVTTAVRSSELVSNHTSFEGAGLYTLTFIVAMNQGVYDGLSDELKAVIDSNSGLDFSMLGADVMLDFDARGMTIAEDLGNNFIEIDAATVEAEWVPAVQPIYESWVADMNERGYDGQALIDRARALMDEYKAAN
ncbi:TRAP-type C4-dicarboxylate transport system, substrate-binding protein [Loktanella sp. DSM 29012]|uniref:TRAP transporter substrate-binding protein n=1 Tax=Loktanella gaetbuli TaxID=2881335 RepID=A0ABS8BYJ1_9RHOB|nr:MULTISPECIES: TRAP transporter substrate-binding protein [Loktanella]MCB5200808.1 TRAP transporter substrate-binding protein [Loktanella gaetbuli]SEQ47757.1 TRAP-type C4-dicarboxylate transport system, substrate-binding protein [Loktanella sp. DSM 29012]